MDYWRKPLDIDKYVISNGTVHIIKDRCKGCDFCIAFCPNHVLETSDEFNVKGYHPPQVVDQEQCVACKLCELICPEFAIYVNESNNSAARKETSYGNQTGSINR